MDVKAVIKISSVLLLALALVFFISWRRDIRGDVLEAEKAVLDVLRARGITDGNILSREEQDWVSGKTVGKTLVYVINSDRPLAMSDLDSGIRDALGHIKNIRIDKVSYNAEPGTAGTANFTIAYKRRQVLSVILKNVLSGWMRAGDGEIDLSREKSVTPDDGRPAVALVLDDLGYSKRNLEALRGMDIPLTLAVLPNTLYAKDVCLFSERNGLEVILHMPMEPENSAMNLEDDTVGGGMAPAVVEDIIARGYESVPTAKGMSNHMGSKATRDEKFMTVVLGELKKRDQFFLDSLTTERSACERVAENTGVTCLKRDIFIDSKSDKDHITRQMREIERLACSGSDVVAIGHDRRATVEVLREFIPEMKKNGIRFVTLSEMIELAKRRQTGDSR